MCDKYPWGFELRLEGAASPPSSFLDTSLSNPAPPARRAALSPQLGTLKYHTWVPSNLLFLPALKFPFSALASAWEKEPILLSRVSFSFRIESCWRCCARCQRTRARSAPRNISRALGAGDGEGRAESAGSGKGGRCRDIATSPGRPLLSVPAALQKIPSI